MEKLMSDEQFQEYTRLSIAFNHWLKDIDAATILIRIGIINGTLQREAATVSNFDEVNNIKCTIDYLKAYDKFVNGFPSKNFIIEDADFITYVVDGISYAYAQLRYKIW